MYACLICNSQCLHYIYLKLYLFVLYYFKWFSIKIKNIFTYFFELHVKYNAFLQFCYFYLLLFINIKIFICFVLFYI